VREEQAARDKGFGEVLGGNGKKCEPKCESSLPKCESQNCELAFPYARKV